MKEKEEFVTLAFLRIEAFFHSHVHSYSMSHSVKCAGLKNEDKTKQNT